eukprot:jgi/Ulvmu1/5983/UM026_0107.1
MTSEWLWCAFDLLVVHHRSAERWISVMPPKSKKTKQKEQAKQSKEPLVAATPELESVRQAHAQQQHVQLSPEAITPRPSAIRRLLPSQESDMQSDAHASEIWSMVFNVLHSAAFVVYLLAGQVHSRMQAHSALLWGSTIVVIILLQPLIFRRAIHQFKLQLQELPTEDGINTLRTQVSQLDLALHKQHANLRQIQQHVSDIDRQGAKEEQPLSSTHLHRALSLLSRGFHCPNLDDWVASAKQEAHSMPHSASVYCFAMGVPQWIRTAMARSKDPPPGFAGVVGEPVILQTLELPGQSQLNAQATCLPLAPAANASGLDTPDKNSRRKKACAQQRLGVVDSSPQYDSSLWRFVKARAWRWRRAPVLRLLSQAVFGMEDNHNRDRCIALSFQGQSAPWFTFILPQHAQMKAICFKHGLAGSTISAVREITIEARSSGSNSTGAWSKIAGGTMAKPQPDGQQSCMILAQVPSSIADTEYRVRAVQLHGQSRYWCIYNAPILIEMDTLSTL